MDAVFSLQRAGTDAVFSLQFPDAGVRRVGRTFTGRPVQAKLEASLWVILDGAVPFEAFDPERLRVAAELVAEGATLEAVAEAVLYAEPGGLVRLKPRRELLKRSEPTAWRRQ